MTDFTDRIVPGETTTIRVSAPEGSTCVYDDTPAEDLWLDGRPMCDDCYMECEYMILCDSCGELTGRTNSRGTFTCTDCGNSWM